MVNQPFTLYFFVAACPIFFENPLFGNEQSTSFWHSRSNSERAFPVERPFSMSATVSTRMVALVSTKAACVEYCNEVA
jgi:hypothetical protein